jgi:hypothetical protein
VTRRQVGYSADTEVTNGVPMASENSETPIRGAISEASWTFKLPVFVDREGADDGTMCRSVSAMRTGLKRGNCLMI